MTQSFGNSDSPANQQALDAVADLLQRLQEGSMVQSFVLLVETVDLEDRWVSAFTAPDQRAWESLGLLHYALNLENSVRLFPEEDGGPQDD
jgi:hypothetical protein